MSQDEELSRVWGHVVSTLESSPDITPRQIAFVRLARPLGLLDGTLLLAVGNDLTKDYLESRVRGEVTSALSSALGREARFAITVDPELAEDAPPALRVVGNGQDQRHETYSQSRDEREADEADARREARPDLSLVPDDDDEPTHHDGAARDRRYPGRNDDRPNRRQPAEPARLNPKYLFETFVIGSSNRFAHAAAVAVAEAPAKAYNPLFIYGDSGLGKTHLLHAIGHYAQNLYPSVRVRYVNSEEFTNDFINSISEGKAGAFQRRYREVDVLLIDDIQFLQGKEQTMEEFFHTFNTLHNANKQVVITSDLPPKQLNGFEDRMRSRFEWGLITDVQPPDLETRIAILRKKAGSERLQAPPDVLEYIASQDLDQHPRARGCADPRHGVRQPQPPAGRPVARGDRPQGPHHRRPDHRDHRHAGDRPDRRVLRSEHRRPVRLEPLARAGHGPPDRDVPVPRAHGPVAAEDRSGVRRSGPHDRHARQPQDPRAHG